MARLPAADTLPASCLRVLAVLLEYHQQQSLPPTLQEIADRLGVSVESIYERLLRLRQNRLVSWEPGCKRTLRVTCRFTKAD